MSISSYTSDLFSIIKEPTLSFCLTSQKPLQKRNGRTDLDLVLKLNKNKLKKQPKSKYLKAKRCIAKLFCHQQKRLIKFERETRIESQLFVYLLQSASSDLSSQSSWSSQTHESGIHSPLCDLQVHSSEPQGLPTNERTRRKLVKKTMWVVYSKSLVFRLRCDSYWDLEWFCQVVFSLYIVKTKLIWKDLIDGAIFI